MDPSDSPPAAPPPLAGSGPAGPTASSAAPDELRFRAVLRTLLGKGQGLLTALRPDRARLLVGSGVQNGVVSILLDRSASEAELVAELSALTSDLGEKQSIVVVSDRSWAARLLTQLKEGAPRGLALYHVAPDGAVQSFASFMEQRPELRAALKAQVGAALRPEEPAAHFFAEMDEVLRTNALQFSEVQSFAQAHGARPVRVVYALLALYAVMFALTYAFGGPEQPGVLWRLGAEVPERVREGEWWRLLSATVLHGGPFHILMNGLVLWNLGTFMERLLGWSRFLVLYVLAGLLGAGLGTLLGPLVKIDLSVGASGCLFGLLGASAVLAFRPAGLPALLVADLKKSAVQNLILNVIVSLQAHIDWTAHLGGAIMGGLLILVGVVRPMALARSGEPGAGPERGARAWAIAGGLAGLALLGCTAMAVAKGEVWLLREPGTTRRVPLPKTGLSVEVPRVLGEPVKSSEEQDTLGLRTVFVLGGPDAGQQLYMSFTSLKTPFSTAEQRKAEWEAGLPVLRNAKPDKDATPVGEPQFTEVSGYPTMDARFTLQSGMRIRRLFQLRAGHTVLLELVTPPNLPPARTIDPKRLLESVKEEGAAPTSGAP